MKRFINWGLFKRCALVMVVSGLIGCGESTNIQSNSGVVTSCESLLGASCVAGRLIDDAAFNVNYVCGTASLGTVKSVTATDGGFSCPNGSDVTFSLTNPADSSIDLELGTVTVKQPAKIYGEQSRNCTETPGTCVGAPIYFYVTPDTLASGSSTKKLNIVRLLQTLSTDTTDPDLPSRRVIISDVDKSKLTADVVDAVEFGAPIASNPASLDPVSDDGTFDYRIKPFLDSIGKGPLIDEAEAEKRLRKAMDNTVAGMYVVPGNSILILGNADPSNTKFNADTGAIYGSAPVGNGMDRSMVGSVWVLVDRHRRVVASGIYSYGQVPSGESRSIWSDPKPMDWISGATWPDDGDLSGVMFKLLESNGADTGLVLKLTQGKMAREAVAGTANIYINLFDETASASDLGTWELKDASAVPLISKGAYTLEHTTPVAVWMNPEIWGNAIEGGEVDFPLPLTVSFFNSDYTNAICLDGSSNSKTGSGSNSGCKIGELRLVVLKDGNVISDKSHKCGIDGSGTIDPDTLTYSTSETELPLGVVANGQSFDTHDGSGTTIDALVLLALLADPSQLSGALTMAPHYEEYFKYIQFGSNTGDYSLLRVDGSSSKYRSYGTCTPVLQSSGLCSVQGSLALDAASWINYYTIARTIDANLAESSSAAELSRNSAGRMEISKTTTCL